jgi:hypothetical protein
LIFADIEALGITRDNVVGWRDIPGTTVGTEKDAYSAVSGVDNVPAEPRP